MVARVGNVDDDVIVIVVVVIFTVVARPLSFGRVALMVVSGPKTMKMFGMWRSVVGFWSVVGSRLSVWRLVAGSQSIVGCR